jgi:hypothetical protein
MILNHESLMTQAFSRLRTADEARLVTHPDDVTTFAIDSFKLVQYASTPPTRLHTKWEGPFKVISSILSEYTLLNLISKKTRTVHASRLKPFIYDPLKQDPMNTAHRDCMEFFVESILLDFGDPRRVSTLLFHLKWLNHASTSTRVSLGVTCVRAKRCTPTYAITRCNVSFLAPTAMALVS